MIVQPKKIENRKSERVPAETVARFKSAKGNSWFPVKVVNVSKTGACIYGFVGASSRQVGTFIEMYLADSEGRDRYVLAEVVWGNSEKAGLRFS